jgi:signal transduction histidine kinase
MIRYVLSTILVGGAVLLTYAIRPVFGGRAPLFFFTIAVALSAAYGGLWCGVFTTILSVVMAGLLFQQSIFLLALAQSSLVPFVLLGAAISVIIHVLHRAHADVVAARTQLELANKQLSQRTEALVRSNEELRGFAYALSHDLQAPLRNVGTLTALLVRRNTNMDNDSREYAHLIVTGIQRMESMIKGLLDYTTATVNIHDREISDCKKVFEQVLNDLRYLIDAEKAIITFDQLPIVPANNDRLAQVFSNLITNALKYRSTRPPEVHVSATDNGTEWVFKVKDNGIGIDMKNAGEIFVLFKRLHSSDEYEGNGIGLAVCKTVIERFGGEIWVDSEPGNGSTFFFTIPKSTAKPSERSSAAVTESLFQSRNAGAN